MKSRSFNLIHGAVALTAGLALFTYTAPVLAGKGGSQSGGGPPFFGRADFVSSAGFNIVDDGVATCSAGSISGGDGVWDYWDQSDPGACDQSSSVPKSDLNNVGQWIIDMRTKTRHLKFLWEPVVGNPISNPDLDTLLNSDAPDSTSGVDLLRIYLTADSLFKNDATRQTTQIDFFGTDPDTGKFGRPYSLVFKEDLYIMRDSTNPDIACLTTVGENGQPDIPKADLIKNSHPKRVVGTYNMPMMIIVRRVAAP